MIRKGRDAQLHALTLYLLLTDPITRFVRLRPSRIFRDRIPSFIDSTCPVWRRPAVLDMANPSETCHG